MRLHMDPFSFLLGKYPGVESVDTFLQWLLRHTLTRAVYHIYTSLLTTVISGFLVVAVLVSVKGSVIVLSIFY